MTFALFVAAAAVFAIVPYAAIRGESRRAYALADAAFWSLLVAGAAVVPHLGIHVAPSLALALFVVVRVAIFFAFLTRHAESGDIRWSPNIAATLAAAIYAIVALQALQWPIDGDEPFYVLVTESIVRDGDLDLRNQYASLEQSVTRRTDLEPQFGDPVGPGGEQYSRHEPFLPLLMIPGYVAGGLHGSVLTIVLFGALLIRALVLLLEEEGFSQRTILALIPLVALAPPVLTYSTRIWPEIPAAYFLTEALRAARRGKAIPLFAALAGLGLLKLRFLAISIPFAAIWIARERRWKLALVVAPLLLVPMALVWAISGHPLNVHGVGELMIQTPAAYARGFFGLLLDAQTGLLFQAPVLFLGLAALAAPRSAPAGFRVGSTAAALYLVLLFPRAEWHGGWSPPLRYIVVFAPLFALGAAAVFERFAWRRPFVWAAVISGALAVHAIAFPWRLFHIANGESIPGELLSKHFHADFSRLFPSFIRPNAAAWIASSLLVVVAVLGVVALRKGWKHAVPGSVLSGLIALLLAGGFVLGMRPGRVVHFEDAHVVRRGGELFPAQYTVARFLYTGGWRLRAGEELEFRHAGGPAVVRYHAHGPVTIRIDGRDYTLQGTNHQFRFAEVALNASGHHRIECIAGETILDRIAVR